MYDALKFLFITALIACIALALAKALHAQLCTSLSIPFKHLDDLKLYEKSTAKLLSPLVYATALITGLAGALATVLPTDPNYIHLISFLAMIPIFISVAGLRSYRIFLQAVRSEGLEWPPKGH